ncbi:CoA transferase [Microbacterium sp. MEC084]|uniref:CaiB/BaiF CoA transferase family protein n=1 Tax=unclassified Microbacterium TaxID=2609290 RepID=UPI000701AC26|nr:MULTISPECIES: CaiB/BaiF CoA-transferase family protein [unclassified Microbacterium]KQY97580.1 CoA-transferase [Microbacterium sp. Root53]MCD1268398.1 CoA transferase [Microbacterium sp. MEC084]
MRPFRPLQGVRVLELGNYIAAPTAGRLLADFGADVIKVERPRTGDELRRWRLQSGDTSMLYRTINRGKRSVVLDLRDDEGRSIALDLIRNSDVLLENFRPGTLDRWGLSSEVLEQTNPDLVVARISAFGQTGPLSNRPGFAAVAEAYGGFRELVGEPGRPPSRTGVSIGDTIAGIYAAFGVVMSLYARLRDAGQLAETPFDERVVDVALNEAMLSVTESLVPEWEAYGIRRERTGGRMQGIAPSNAYLCADGKSIVVAGNGDSIYQRYMTAIGRDDLAKDPALQSNEGRWEARDLLDDAIGGWAATLPSAEALRILDAAGVPSGPIYTAEDVCTDEQYAARDMIQRFDVDDGAGVRPAVGFPGIVPVFGGRSLPISHVGPDLGQHTREILAELGWDDARIDAYEEALR